MKISKRKEDVKRIWIFNQIKLAKLESNSFLSICRNNHEFVRKYIK